MPQQKPLNLANIGILVVCTSLLLGVLYSWISGMKTRDKLDMEQYYLQQGLTTSGHERKKQE